MTPISKLHPRARIRLDAIRHNLQVLKNHAGKARVMAVVKGNAYGHGLPEVANALRDADGFGVARMDEARTLRNAGIEQPVTVLGGIFAADLDEASALGLRNVVHTMEQLEAIENYAGQAADAWLKIDSGMHRLGFNVDDVAKMVARLEACKAIDRFGVMTHLANADDPGDGKTITQTEQFRKSLGGFAGEISIANSAGVLGWPNLHDGFRRSMENGEVWVRPGLALYGIAPIVNHTGAQFDLEPAMQFEAPLISVKPLRGGDAVGYGQTWCAKSDTTIGIVAAGYADGYSHNTESGCPVIINGRQAELAGVVSMDLLAIDLGPNARDQVGDTAILWGDDLPVEDVARFAGTIPYTLVTGVTARVVRNYE